MLDSPGQVMWCLTTYTDWWQPSTTSVLQVGAARRRSNVTDAAPPGMLDAVGVRAELCRRVAFLEERDRELLYLWYVVQLPALDIAKALGISRRQCFRRRSSAIQGIVEFGRAASA
jgi:DNA-directed RNA polymerase specialized sigma subunit